MGAMKLVLAFIDSLPNDKREGFAPCTKPHTIYKDTNFRLDLCGMTSNHDWDLRIQVNYECNITSKTFAPETIAGPVFVDHKAPQTPAEIRALFKDKIMRNMGPSIPAQPNRGMPSEDLNA